MHILLTDLLSCPRCGPDFGLVVLADQFEERQVVTGRLGCANCRASYEISEGVADLRYAAVPALPETSDFDLEEERLFRAAALLGVTTPSATVLVVEPTGRAPQALASVLKGVHIVGLGAAPGEHGAGESSVLSPLMSGERLPFRNASLHAVGLLGVASQTLLEEAARVLMPGARLVVDPASDEVAEKLLQMGFKMHLQQEGVVVAGAPGPG